MRRNNRLPLVAAVLCLGLGLGLNMPVAAQKEFKEPETIITQNVLRLVLDEVSGQRAFNNIAMMAGYNRVRTPEEMTSILYEADYLGKVLKGYGLDQVNVEANKLFKPVRTTWWVGHEGELRMVEPQARLLARLDDQPALIVRGSDNVDCEGELVYLDRRDEGKLEGLDLTGKIILSPEYPGMFVAGYKKGALGVISYNNFVEPLSDPDQVCFDMSFPKGDFKGKAFGLMVSVRQGTQLKDMVLNGQRVVVHVKTRGEYYPWKADTVFAAIKGTNPDAKGLMFTAHLFERPAKIGANDNISGCAALSEIARTLAALINSGRIPRPERSIYFLMSEEGSGTAAYFQNHPEMAGKILGDINMDMVGESLDMNSAFLHIERSLFSKTGYLESVARNFAEFVMKTNVESHGVTGLIPGESFPLPIIEKNGSRGSFRYMMEAYSGGSDHGMFLEADVDLPAISFIVWPDKWYHTDQDTPDKSDPTQLKRVSFIGVCSALAVCSGNEETIMNLGRKTYEDRMDMVQEAYADGLTGLSERKSLDGGRAYGIALNGLTQSVSLAQSAIERVRELAVGKPRVEKYLAGLKAETGGMLPYYDGRLSNYYSMASTAAGIKPEKPKAAAEDAALEKIVPVKVEYVKLGEFFPFERLFDSVSHDPALSEMVFSKLGVSALMEMYLMFDGRHTMAEIRDMLSYEFKPCASSDIMTVAKAIEKAGMIKLNAGKA